MNLLDMLTIFFFVSCESKMMVLSLLFIKWVWLLFP